MVEVVTPEVAGTTVVITVEETGTRDAVTADTLALAAGQSVTSGAHEVTVISCVLYTTEVTSVVRSVVTAVTFDDGVGTTAGVDATLTGPVPLTGGDSGVEAPPLTSEEIGAEGVISGPDGVEAEDGVGTTGGPAGVEEVAASETEGVSAGAEGVSTGAEPLRLGVGIGPSGAGYSGVEAGASGVETVSPLTSLVAGAEELRLGVGTGASGVGIVVWGVKTGTSGVEAEETVSPEISELGIGVLSIGVPTGGAP